MMLHLALVESRPLLPMPRRSVMEWQPCNGGAPSCLLSDAAAEPSDASSAASVFFCSPVSQRASAGESGSRPRTSKPISSVGAAWRGRMRRDYKLGESRAADRGWLSTPSLECAQWRS